MRRWRGKIAGLLALALAGCLAGCGPEEGENPGGSELPEGPVEAAITVERVDGLPDDFAMGVDISSVVAELASGVTYQDFEGNTIDDVDGFCRLLADSGVTHVRVRIWNDPYDADGNGYGGGNNDVAAAVEIAQGCAQVGLAVLLDFHGSDFWADPAKQQAPKEWADLDAAGKADALGDFLTQALTQIGETGADIAMVQVGNETTGGFIGETDPETMCQLFSAGAAAVRAYDPDIQVAIHVTNPERETMTTWAATLEEYAVDYDVLATSYYPSWHGTLENLADQLTQVRESYGKDVLVAETSYPYTMADTDGHGNTVQEGSNTDMMCETQYPFSPQGQASFLRDLIHTVCQAGGLGVYYWEPAWITVGDTTGLTGADYEAQVAANQTLWEEHGSGWASSYAAEYDPDDAGAWYGGSAVDNQALFGPDGAPLDSLMVWRYVHTGAVSDQVAVEGVAALEETIDAGGSYTLPDAVTVTYTGGAVEEPVTWTQADVDGIDPATAGTYVVNGMVTLSREVTAGDYAGQSELPVTYTLTVRAGNLAGADWSFENGDGNLSGLVEKTDLGDVSITEEDPADGTHALHWYLVEGGSAQVAYLGADRAGIALPAGTYTFQCSAQGFAGDTVTLSVLDHATGTVLAAGEAAAMGGWAIWQTPTVTFTLEADAVVDLGIALEVQPGGWGTVDCLLLN